MNERNETKASAINRSPHQEPASPNNPSDWIISFCVSALDLELVIQRQGWLPFISLSPATSTRLLDLLPPFISLESLLGPFLQPPGQVCVSHLPSLLSPTTPSYSLPNDSILRVTAWGSLLNIWSCFPSLRAPTLTLALILCICASQFYHLSPDACQAGWLRGWRQQV